MQRTDTTASTSTTHSEKEKSHVNEKTDERPRSTKSNVGSNLGGNEKNKEFSGETRQSQDASTKDATRVTEAGDEKQTPTAVAKEDGAEDEEIEDESKYLSGFKLAILSVGLCLTRYESVTTNTI